MPSASAFEPWEEPERVYQDRTLTCRDCSEEFIFSTGEQAFFASKGLTNDPQRCPTCRAAAKRARTVGGPREFHAAICGACGGQAIVPFAPRNDRPVYCSSCFDKVRAGTITAPATV
jgi:CxxC-x17-CxxC domain-containing protein